MFTANTGYLHRAGDVQPPFKWLMHLVASVARLRWRGRPTFQRPPRDPKTQTVKLRAAGRALRVVAARRTPLQSGSLRRNQKITGTGKGPVAQISKHFFCHLHCGIHIKRSTSRYLFTGVGLKVRVFPQLGRA